MKESSEVKYMCKFCNKSFPCGRSLGGHMRSHLTNKSVERLSSSSTTHSQLDAGYVLRENPKKSLRFSISDDDDDDDSNEEAFCCRECGKAFQTWKSLFSHVKTHSDSMVLDSQSDNETPEKSLIQKRKKKRSQRRNNVNSNSCSCVSENEQEQEEVAMCLIMLSRDVNRVKSLAESSDNFSGASKPTSSKLSRPSFSGDSPSKKLVAETRTEASVAGFSKRKESNNLGKRKAIDAVEKTRFECTTCSKKFHSYQALGGHRASHKKTRGCFASNNADENSENSLEIEEESRMRKIPETRGLLVPQETPNGVDSDSSNFRVRDKKSKGHECPICLKVFQSGQALGGHKRSHMINGSDHRTSQSKAVEIEKPVSEIRDFLDLNLPAPEEEEEIVASMKPWWAENSHKHDTLVVGLISN